MARSQSHLSSESTVALHTRLQVPHVARTLERLSLGLLSIPLLRGAQTARRISLLLESCMRLARLWPPPLNPARRPKCLDPQLCPLTVSLVPPVAETSLICALLECTRPHMLLVTLLTPRLLDPPSTVKNTRYTGCHNALCAASNLRGGRSLADHIQLRRCVTLCSDLTTASTLSADIPADSGSVHPAVPPGTPTAPCTNDALSSMPAPEISTTAASTVTVECSALALAPPGSGTAVQATDHLWQRQVGSIAELALGSSPRQSSSVCEGPGTCDVLGPSQSAIRRRPLQHLRLDMPKDDPMHPADQPSPRLGSTARPQRPSRGSRQPSSTKGKGKGKGKGRGKSKPPSSDSFGGQSSHGFQRERQRQDEDWTPSYSGTRLLYQVARLALRQESQMQMIIQDVRLHFYFRPTPPASVLPLIQRVATRWRNIMETEPGKLSMSLRETMLRELLQELRSRVKAFQTSSDMPAKAQKMGWTDSQGAWNYLRWNPAREVEELVPMVESRTTDSLLQDISEIESHLSGETIRNFKSVRPFNPSGHYNTEWVQFHLDIELRTSGDIMWTKLHQLGHSPLACSSTSTRSAISVSTHPIHPGSTLGGGLVNSASPPPCPPSCLGLHVAALVLTNPRGTACYMNCLVLALLHHLACLQVASPDELGALRGLHGALSRSTAPIELGKCFTWVMLVNPWPPWLRQSDAAEFLQHLLPRLKLPCFRGSWRARRLEHDSLCIRDHGATDMGPIQLVITGAESLQDCNDQWHTQPSVHALTRDTKSFWLQLLRFSVTGKGARRRHVKDSRPVLYVLHEFLMPVFDDAVSLEVSHLPFQATAVVMHHGPQVTSGHYRSVLQHDKKLWCTDDCIPACSPSASIVQSDLPHDSYLLLCRSLSVKHYCQVGTQCSHTVVM